jgi:hypothetical protein
MIDVDCYDLKNCPADCESCDISPAGGQYKAVVEEVTGFMDQCFPGQNNRPAVEKAAVAVREKLNKRR